MNYDLLLLGRSEVEYPGISAVKPVLTNDYLVLSEGSPCGDHCYRHVVADEPFLVSPFPSVSWRQVSNVEIELSPLEFNRGRQSCDYPRNYAGYEAVPSRNPLSKTLQPGLLSSPAHAQAI